MNIMEQNSQKTMKTKYKKGILNRHEHTRPKQKETETKSKQ
jgi:hypothetical protein